MTNISPNRAAPAAPDFAEARAFLTDLDPTATFFTFQTFDDVKGRHDGSLTRVLHGPLDDAMAATLADLNARGAGVFVTVNATDGKGRTKENILRLRSTWHDQDNPAVEPLFPQRWSRAWWLDPRPASGTGIG